MDRETLWLIRHAESEWNAAGRWQGQADPPLSLRGREQARRLAEALRNEGLQVLVASDLARTAQTARILGSALEVELHLEPRLRELDAGSWSGHTRAEIEERDGGALSRFDSGDPLAAAGGAECRADVARRARRALRDWRARLAGRRLAVVSHEGVLGSLVQGLVLGQAEWRRVGSAELLGDEAAA